MIVYFSVPCLVLTSRAGLAERYKRHGTQWEIEISSFIGGCARSGGWRGWAWGPPQRPAPAPRKCRLAPQPILDHASVQAGAAPLIVCQGLMLAHGVNTGAQWRFHLAPIALRTDDSNFTSAYPGS